MAAEIKSIKDNTRRLKDLAIRKAIDILEFPDKYDKELHDATFLKVIGNAVPRSTEITGEDGGALILEISETIARKNNINATNTITDSNSEGHTQI